jgi:hypothetical protein
LQVLLWALYFDNFPHGHYGTIRQQIWSLLHFPFQLAIVGIVEGSQQLVLARYVIKNWEKIAKAIDEACWYNNEDGQTLQDSLLEMLEYWNFEGKAETLPIQEKVLAEIYDIGNATGICSLSNITEYDKTGEVPLAFGQMMFQMFDGVYVGLGMKLPVDKLEKYSASGIAVQSWQLVYLYFWVSFCLFVICTIVFMVLIRRHRADVFDFVSIGIRLVALAVGGALIALIGNDNGLYSFLASPGILPTCLSLLFLILFFDRLSAAFCNWHLRKSGQLYAEEYAEEHHRGGHGETDEHAVLASGLSHHGSNILDHRKSTAWSVRSDMEPLAGETGYHGAEQGYAMRLLMSPPVVSPPPMGSGSMHGEYAPIGREHYGA